MKISIYARVSTKSDRQDLQNQLTPLRDWALRLGGEIVFEYVDEASGTKGDRSGLKQLMQDARLKKFDTLLIWALDRLSREGIHKMTGYLEELKRNKVRVLSHQESWLDTDGPVSDLLIAIFGWVAQQERNRISERVKAGLDRAKAKKIQLGRPTTLYSKARIKELRLGGLSTRKISREIGVSHVTVSRVLQNP